MLLNASPQFCSEAVQLGGIVLLSLPGSQYGQFIHRYLQQESIHDALGIIAVQRIAEDAACL
ncbi:hypothetical protein D3C80_1266560 [compost metagenome]